MKRGPSSALLAWAAWLGFADPARAQESLFAAEASIGWQQPGVPQITVLAHETASQAGEDVSASVDWSQVDENPVPALQVEELFAYSTTSDTDPPEAFAFAHIVSTKESERNDVITGVSRASIQYQFLVIPAPDAPVFETRVPVEAIFAWGVTRSESGHSRSTAFLSGAVEPAMSFTYAEATDTQELRVTSSDPEQPPGELGALLEGQRRDLPGDVCEECPPFSFDVNVLQAYTIHLSAFASVGSYLVLEEDTGSAAVAGFVDPVLRISPDYEFADFFRVVVTVPEPDPRLASGFGLLLAATAGRLRSSRRSGAARDARPGLHGDGHAGGARRDRRAAGAARLARG
jgi:hypothetical protein